MISTGRTTGTIRWMAPEILPEASSGNQDKTFATDVYAFALCLDTYEVNHIQIWGTLSNLFLDVFLTNFRSMIIQ